MPFGHPQEPTTEISPHCALPARPEAMDKNGVDRPILQVGKDVSHYHGRPSWNPEHGTCKTYGDILQEYEFHPESKCADTIGNPCAQQTIGLLERRHIRVEQIKYIGKESNALEDVESGLIHSEQSVYTEYPDPRRDEWQAKTLPIISDAPLLKLAKMSGMSPSALKEIRSGRARPIEETRSS